VRWVKLEDLTGYEFLAPMRLIRIAAETALGRLRRLSVFRTKSKNFRKLELFAVLRNTIYERRRRNHGQCVAAVILTRGSEAKLNGPVEDGIDAAKPPPRAATRAHIASARSKRIHGIVHAQAALSVFLRRSTDRAQRELTRSFVAVIRAVDYEQSALFDLSYAIALQDLRHIGKADFGQRPGSQRTLSPAESAWLRSSSCAKHKKAGGHGREILLLRELSN